MSSPCTNPQCPYNRIPVIDSGPAAYEVHSDPDRKVRYALAFIVLGGFLAFTIGALALAASDKVLIYIGGVFSSLLVVVFAYFFTRKS